MAAPHPVIVEVCVDSVESSLAAQQGGAARVELCSALLEGGLTPGQGVVQVARERLTIGLQVMIRPRGGDFLYSDVEFDVMRRDIDMARAHRADGVVFGLLLPNGTVDVARTRELIDRARPLAVTFHRAFDVTRDPLEALDTLIDLGVERVLTSGQEASALEGVDLLSKLVELAGTRIIVMPGGGIHERSLERILRETRAREVHVTGTKSVESGMTFHNPRCFMGGELRPPEYSSTVTDPARIRALVHLAALGHL
jgi:copper homeostasis protein